LEKMSRAGSIGAVHHDALDPQTVAIPLDELQEISPFI